jgi:DNA-cytosine methyltransferase
MSEGKKEKINVLSLFDGMSCGQIALNKIGIEYENYFASEIDKYAIQVTQNNYPNTIQLGSVTEVKGSDLPQIDLLFGGSPCQGFSFAGKQLNFEDERSKLFFEFVRLLEECKPKYFLLENVKMKKEYQDVISNFLGVEPIEINSNLLSAQNRERLYWTNIPNIEQPKDKKLYLKDVVDLNVINRNVVDKNKIKQFWETKNYIQYDLSGKGHKSQDQRGYYLNSKHGTLPSHGASSKVKVVLNNGEIVQLTPVECERLQTVPDGYTDCVSDTQRYTMLGNGWTVDVIAHIFKQLPTLVSEARSENN